MPLGRSNKLEWIGLKLNCTHQILFFAVLIVGQTVLYRRTETSLFASNVDDFDGKNVKMRDHLEGLGVHISTLGLSVSTFVFFLFVFVNREYF